MKNLKLTMSLIALITCFSSPAAFAGSSVNSPSFLISCEIPGLLQIDVSIIQPVGNASVNAMAFGSLAPLGNNLLPSTTAPFVISVKGSAGGSAYTISQTATTLASDANTIPSGACVVSSQYFASDNNNANLPSGANLPVGGSWVGNRILYDSGSDTTERTIKAIYSMTNPLNNSLSTEGIPLNQAPGTYSGQVTFTISAK